MASVYRKRGVWYARHKDAAGRWRATATTAPTKTAAQRFAEDLERKAERQRHGLEALPQQTTLTLGELCGWWLENHGIGAAQKPSGLSLRRNVIDTDVGGLPLAATTAGRIEEHFRRLERERHLGPKTINNLRASIRAAFNRARKAGLWSAGNPAADTEPRKVPKRAYVMLAAEEVPIMLAHVSPDWRGFMAAGAYLGLRKGEAAGLRKADVDLAGGLVTIRASYDNATTKGKHADVLPIPAPLVPFIETGLRSPGAYVFPAPDGSMRGPYSGPEKALRFALGRAGIVDGYDHVCRRCKAQKRKEHTRRHVDKAPRKCPTCGMSLWAKAIPRPLRYHDLRHSAATALLRAGVDTHRVQRILRHASVTTTTGVYGHLLAEDLRAAMATTWQTAPDSEPASEPVAVVLEAVGGANSAPFVTRLLPDGTKHAEGLTRPACNTPTCLGKEMVGAKGFEPSASWSRIGYPAS